MLNASSGPRGLVRALLSMVILSLSLVSMTAYSQSTPKKQLLALATSSVGGAWYPFGGALASLVSKKVPYLDITAETSGGAADNIYLIDKGEDEFAMTTTADAYNGLHGKEPFKKPHKNFSAAMGSGDGLYWQLYTLKKTGIRSIEDLKGKRVSLGAPGSMGNSVGKAVLEAYGLIEGRDWTAEYLSRGEGPDALLDGNVDAVLATSSIPTAPVIDITSRQKSNVVFLNPDPDTLAKLKEKYPYWQDATIPGGTYTGFPDDIPGLFGVTTILVASNDLDTQTVYDFVKAIIENNSELAEMNRLGKLWSRDHALNGVEGLLPLHPGAKKYFEEAGLLTAEKH